MNCMMFLLQADALSRMFMHKRNTMKYDISMFLAF
jgi:hypothetical protein